MKVLTIVGARPQFIKAAMVSRAFAADGRCNEVMVHTGQHFDANMSDVFFQELEIPNPKYHLGIGGGSHGQNTGRMLEAIDATILKERPDALIVYGDTDSTIAGALAAAKLHVPVIHIEAGLRSFNKKMPEEVNRKLTDHVSTLLLTPNDAAIENLKAEGISGTNVHNIGDVMYDAALYYGTRASSVSKILDQVDIDPHQYVLATVHRQENTDNPERLTRIMAAFGNAAHRVVLPLHPRTRNRLSSFGISIPDNVTVIEPLGYLDMVMLEKYAVLIATDSGGVQKEAYFYEIPCVTIRDETEWAELVETGWNRLVSPDSDALLDVFCSNYPQGTTGLSLYGHGQAANQAVTVILDTFDK